MNLALKGSLSPKSPWMKWAPGADLGGWCRGWAPLPGMTYGFLIQLVFCKKCGLSSNIEPRHSEWKKNVSDSRAPSSQSTDQNLRRLLLFDFRTCPVPSYDHWLFRVMPICVMPFRVIPICVMPFRVMPFCVMPICIMPFRVMPFCVMPICVMPFRVMPICVMPLRVMPFTTQYALQHFDQLHDTWNGFLPFSFGLICIRPDLKHRIGLLLFSFESMHVQFCHRYTFIPLRWIVVKCSLVFKTTRAVIKIWNKHNSLHLERKYARIFVLGHCLFLEAHSFPRATLSKSCSLLGIDDVRGQIS